MTPDDLLQALQPWTAQLQGRALDAALDGWLTDQAGPGTGTYAAIDLKQKRLAGCGRTPPPGITS